MDQLTLKNESVHQFQKWMTYPLKETRGGIHWSKPLIEWDLFENLGKAVKKNNKSSPITHFGRSNSYSLFKVS